MAFAHDSLCAVLKSFVSKIYNLGLEGKTSYEWQAASKLGVRIKLFDQSCKFCKQFAAVSQNDLARGGSLFLISKGCPETGKRSAAEMAL